LAGTQLSLFPAWVYFDQKQKSTPRCAFYFIKSSISLLFCSK
jgi:hypothetical protein